MHHYSLIKSVFATEPELCSAGKLYFKDTNTSIGGGGILNGKWVNFTDLYLHNTAFKFILSFVILREYWQNLDAAWPVDEARCRPHVTVIRLTSRLSFVGWLNCQNIQWLSIMHTRA